MISLFAGGSLCILTAESSGIVTGFFEDDYGSIVRSPVGVIALGARLIGLYHGTGKLFLELSGDQTATTSGHTLDISGTTYAVASATVSYVGASNKTRFEWTASSPFSAGSNYIVRFDD